MSDFDLDLQAAEAELDETDGGRVVLGVLDGTTDGEEWVDLVRSGNVLVLSVEGNLNELAAPFARDIRDLDGDLVHFREFLVVTPPGIDVDNDRLD